MQHGRMTPDNATHAGYTTAATGARRSTHMTTRMLDMRTCPRPYAQLPRRPTCTNRHVKKESSSRPKKERQHV